jgi:uncharacterized membrane protein YphA (DoxX/SURF4 family)
MKRYLRISLLGMFALVLLRVAIGWHFYMEGVSKVRGGDFTSRGFLGAATGPMADTFRGMIWDRDGRIRGDVPRMKGVYEEFVRQAKEDFGLDEAGQRRADAILARHLELLSDIEIDHREALIKHVGSLPRQAELMADGVRRQPGKLRDQALAVRADWQREMLPVLGKIDKVGEHLQREINQLGAGSGRSTLRLPLPERPRWGTDQIDPLIPIFDMSIGILLMVGLLTPVAGTLAAGFLLMVILTQFPGYPEAQPTYYQAIELAGCLVLVGCDAGRYFGLDFFPWCWWQARRRQKLAEDRDYVPSA